MKRLLQLLCGLGALTGVLWLQGETSAADKVEKEQPAGKGGYGGYGRNATGGAGHPTVEVRTFKELSDALKKGNATILLKADIDVPTDAPTQALSTTASNITLDGQGHTIHGDNMPQPLLLGSIEMSKLGRAGVSKEVLAKLTPLKDKKFESSEKLSAELEKLLTKDELDRFKSVVVDRAKNPDKGAGSRHILLFTGGKNYILKNFRVRNANAGGNIRFFGSASDIVIDHVSSTGCYNKGISISNGCHDATVTNCFIAGNTRSMFIKYDTNRITVDHCIFVKSWIRSPLLVDVKEFDVRNNYVQEWTGFGTGIGGASNGNLMGNIYVCPADTKGPANKSKAAYTYLKGPAEKIFVKDNVFKGCTGTAKSTTDKPLDRPAIIPAYTSDLEKLEKDLLSDTTGAGCMPRDAVDKAYLVPSDNWAADSGKPFRVPESLSGKGSGVRGQGSDKKNTP